MNSSVPNSRRPLIAGVLAIALVVVGYAVWNHLRQGHDHGAAELALDDGQRWATDEPLRLGMQRIRDAVAPALVGPTRHNLSQEQAEVLAEAVQGNVTYLIQNCKLEPAADANLHVLITELLEGAAMVSANPSSDDGITKLAHALLEYPKYFDHPDWRPLPEPKS